MDRQAALEKFRTYADGGWMRVPKPVDAAWLQGAEAAGLLPKSALKDGDYYLGRCRNARVARWDAGRGVFVYMREKFGSRFPEDIKHPEDDDGFDLFLPVAEVEPLPLEVVPPGA